MRRITILIVLFILHWRALGSCNYAPLLEDATKEIHSALESAALGAGTGWQRGSAKTIEMAAAVKSGDQKIISELTNALHDKSPIVRGMAALVLLEGGKKSEHTLPALSEMIKAPQFNGQKWTNVTSSGSSDARIRIVDSLLNADDKSQMAADVLHQTIFGAPNDPAVLCTQLHVASRLREANPPELLVKVMNKGGPVARSLPEDVVSELKRYDPSAKADPVAAGDSQRRAEREKVVQEINAKYKGKPGFEKAEIVRDEIFIFYASGEDSLRFPELHRYSDFYTSDKEVKWEFERLYGATAGYAGIEVAPNDHQITLYFDRTRNWGNFPTSFGSWKVRTIIVSPVEAERIRKSQHN